MPDSKNELVNEAIDASIKFEELMDKTDFDSWLDDDDAGKDNAKILEDLGQDPSPFRIYEENKKKLKGIYVSINSGEKKSNNSGDKSFLEEIIFNLFQSKYIRMEARICSNKKDEEDKYREALYHLLSGLYTFQNPAAGNIDEWLLVLLYNDLSICYAGLDNSSLSRGYAEEARNIIEGKQRDFKKDPNLYYLYTIAIFNQAVAEKRSYLYTEAERNFKRIIGYVENNSNMSNFNYFSALLNISDLYMDLGRGKEAIELLNKIKIKDEYDIRYWNAYLVKVNALIDQSEFEKAEIIIIDKFLIRQNNGYILNKRHQVTAQGLKAINYFARCQIEKAINVLLKPIDSENKDLKISEDLIKYNLPNIIKRKQKGLETKAYKKLSEIYEIFEDDDKSREYLIKFITGGRIDCLRNFIKQNEMDKLIEYCEDLNVLESFVNQIIKVMKPEYKELMKIIKEKILKECEEKYQLSRAARMVKKIDKEIIEEKKGIMYPGDSAFKDMICSQASLTEEDIGNRLDINEKEFDSVLFKRREMRNNILELIVLRRWNSFSPGLYRGNTESLGGGYLLRIRKGKINKLNSKENYEVENIAIDPGYNFIQNFRREGFYINDIDTIIVTHSHLDHCAELMPIMDLLYQINKRYKYNPDKNAKQKKIKLCLSKGAYRKYSSYIDDPDWKKQLKDVIIIENIEKGKCRFNGISVSAIPTRHMDYGGVNAIGLKFEIIIEGNDNIILGFTGDTPWNEELIEYFKGCDILCVHLGSIKYQEIGYTDERSESINKRNIPDKEKQNKFIEIYENANHLLFFGTIEIIDKCVEEKKSNLIIVSEFGEELKYGIRSDLCMKIANKLKIDCIPGDIGLYIGINKQRTIRVRCNFCEEFVAPEDIETFSYGLEDALHYICQTCQNTLSELQKHALIEHRVTRH